MDPHRSVREPALLAFAAAGVLLGGFLVVRMQAFIVFERQMRGAQFREPTLIEAPLVWAGAAALATGVLLRWSLTRRGVRLTWGGASARALYVVVASATWYALAVAQWWIVVAGSESTPHTTVRDPTPLDSFLLVAVGGAVVVAAVTAHAGRRRRLFRERARAAAGSTGLGGGGYDSRGVRVALD